MLRRLLLALVCGQLIGCGSRSSSEPETRKSGGGRVIGVSLLTLQNPFFKVIGDNITAAAQKAGFETLILSAENDPAKQANQVKDFVVRKTAAIVLSPAESRAMVPIIQEANEAGIPVFTVDIPCREPGVKIVTQVATDNEQGGREAAKAMIEALGPSGGKVAIVHFKQAESCRLRVKGFRSVIEAHDPKGGGRIAIVAELEGGGSKDLGFKAAKDALQTHPDLRGIFAINDPSALGAVAALGDAKVVVVGFDGQPEGKQAIKEGKIYADPVQDPARMGREVVGAILQHFRGETPPPEILIPADLYRRKDALNDPALE